MMATSIDFYTTEYNDDPLDDVLYDTLIHLMEYIWGDEAIDVDKWKL